MQMNTLKALGIIIAVVALALVGYMLLNAGSQLAHKSADQNAQWEMMAK
jgi:hypothetical protein